MKNLFGLIFLMVCVFGLNAQDFDAFPKSLLYSTRQYANHTVEVPKYKLKNQHNGIMYFPIPYAETDFLGSEGALKHLKTLTITKVELVYTDFTRGKNLDELNQKRLLKLYKSFPEIFNSSVIEWKFVKQTGANELNMAKDYFHGIVFTYREFKGFKYEKDNIQEFLKKGKVKDSTIYKVFKRYPQWNESPVVVDVTGSMFPYTQELFLWLKLNNHLKLSRLFTFFNDDEENSNNQMSSFDTSGLWNIDSDSYEKVLKTCLIGMENGSHYENNLEAIFNTLRKKGNIKEIVMIADNWEDPCDMKLLNELKSRNVPVHIIVCGVDDVVNTNYLDIAHATNGSVHTTEFDLERMMNLSNGSVIKFGNSRYKIVNGKFIYLEPEFKLI